jgi:hypothetical protein
MEQYLPYQIKSFKHNGHLHRVWLENWLVPDRSLAEAFRREDMIVLINSHTPIVESSGKQWVSRVPGVSVFIPGQWYNVVALMEERGLRYYCNIASPPYKGKDVVTYIDYDLDVIVTGEDGGLKAAVVDREEFAAHRIRYKYSRDVVGKVESGLDSLLRRVERGGPPFDAEAIQWIYECWREHFFR